MITILVTNDDGVHAKGIRVLAQTLSSIANIVIVAPDRNRSGASNSLSLSRPLRANQIEPNVYSIDGTPTDCVHLAITGLLDRAPDMVVAGVNAGANLGDDILYSGTVAAASEGRFLGLPAIAVSLASEACLHYETGAQVARSLVEKVQKQALPGDTILNVNVPDVPFADLAGFEVTRLGTRHCAEPTIKETDPRGRPIYWIGPPGQEADAGVGTDFHAVRSGHVSLTSIQLDLTNYKLFEQLSSWAGDLNATV